jgi:FkbM family methyltransferase
MNKNLFLYWVGNDYKLIKILRNLIYLHSKNGNGYNVILINETNINDYVKDIPDNFKILCPAHQADFVRVNVILDYGGIWLDSDILVIDKLDSLFDILEKNDGFFYKDHNGVINNGLFGSKKNTSLMLQWKTNMINILNNKSYKIGWCDIGSSLLQNMLNNETQLYDNYIIFDGQQNVYPVMWNNCVKEFLEKPYDNYKNLLRDYQPLVVLVNSVYKKIELMEKKEIFDGNMPLTYFINKSYQNLKLSKNILYNDYSIFNYGTIDYISNSIITYKCWEPNVTNLFDTIIHNNNDCVILDIGCNIGYFSLVSSKHKNINKILSIDGNTQNITMLNMSCIYNNISNIYPINVCVADKKTYYKMANKDVIDKNNNIGGLSFKEIDEGENKDIYIKTLTIDDIIDEYKLNKIDLLKIDIEGGEKNALLGLSNALNKGIIKNIIVELSPCFNNDSEDILNILFKNNYDIYNIPHKEIGYNNNDNTFLEKIMSTKISNIKQFISTIERQTNILACLTNIFLPKKIIIITDWIETYLTLEPYLFAKKLLQFNWEIIRLSELNIINLKQRKCIVLCITYDDLDLSLLICDNITLIYKLDDVYPYKEIRNKCINSADYIIGPYQYLFKSLISMYPNIDKKESFNIPYSAVDDFYVDINYNNKPIQKILVSGAINDAYPLRKYILQFNKYIEILDHPSYKTYSHDYINKRYYEKLSEYLCCFCDTSVHKYVLLKIYECCSVGSLLLVDDIINKELNNLGFYDCVNCIFCNKTNIEDKIKWILDIDNREIIDVIRKEGMKLVRKKHNTSLRSLQFDTLIQNKFIKKNFICRYNNDIYFTPDKTQIEYINTGRAEPYSGNVEIVKEYIKNNNRNNTYIDVGVNIGTHSIVYSKIFNNVIAFEPDEYNYNQSKENFIINNVHNINLYNKGLGDCNKFVSMKRHSEHSRGCLYTVNGGNIECVTLDSLELNNIDYIKIDVEGNELSVLRGAIETINRNQPIIEFEFNELATKLFNIKYKDIEYFLNNIGYFFDKKENSNYYFVYNNKQIFKNIYENSLWNGNNENIPLSGPGSSLENTISTSELLDKFIYDNNCISVTDIGCGDLTWMPKTNFFNDNNIKYIGIDVVDSLITSHSIKFNNKKFICEDITKFKDIDHSSLIIIRDVIFHLTNLEIVTIFSNIKYKFDYIAITSCKNNANSDNFDKYHYSPKNIHMSPFNISQNYAHKINEDKFNRNFFIYKHNDFYNI